MAAMGVFIVRLLALAATVAAAAPPPAQPAARDHCLLAHRSHSLFQQRRLARESGAIALGSGASGACDAAAACPPCGEEGSCMLWGDPHVYVFDGKAHLRILEDGDFWIVRSDCVSIQARYGPAAPSGSPAVIQALAVGGSFLQGHVLLVEPKGGLVTWDGGAILDAFPSAFEAPGLVRATYADGGEHVDPGLGGMPLRSVEAKLPYGIKLVVNRWSDHLDVLITMRPLPGGQDGHCGNFNGDAADDTLELIQARSAGARVAEGDRLLAPGKGLPEGGVHVMAAALDDCATAVRAKAEALCRKEEAAEVGEVAPASLEDCIFDVCFGGPKFARADAVIEGQMAQRAAHAMSDECLCDPPTTTTAEAPTTTTPVDTSAPTTTAPPTTSPSTTATTTTTTQPTTTTTSTTTSTTAAPTTTTTTTGEPITCVVWGDPHVVTFDLFRLFGSDWDSDKRWQFDNRGHWRIGRTFIPAVLASGDFWLVEGSRIGIQGRYGTRKQDWWPLDGLAFGGAFLDGHVLTIEQMWEGKAVVAWDGKEVSDPSSFEFGGLATVRVKKARGGKFESADVSLPDGVSLQIRRWVWNLNNLRSSSVSCTIRMPKQADGQDGHCGRADGDLRDDTTAYLRGQSSAEVSGQEAWFTQKAMNKNSFLQNADDPAHPCALQLSAEHEALCMASFESSNISVDIATRFMRACAFDVCAASGDPGAAQAALSASRTVQEYAETCGRECRVAAGRPIQWFTRPKMCLEIGGGQPLNGSSVELWECDRGIENRQFLLPPGGEGQIKWASHPSMCLDVAGGKPQNGARVQIWECQAGQENMIFTVPEGDHGKIRWTAHPGFCFDVTAGRDTPGTPIQLWECMEEGHSNKEFLVAGGLA